MNRLTVLAPVAVFFALLSSCATDRDRVDGPSGATESMRDDRFESADVATDVPAAMQAKLSHASGLLEGILLEAYEQVETNARALKTISEGADWLAHESPAYFEYSAAFRVTCDDLALHARKHDLDALAEDYAALMNTCVACHRYLRTERQKKDMPGRVSLLNSVRSTINSVSRS